MHVKIVSNYAEKLACNLMKDSCKRAIVLNSPMSLCVKLAVDDRVEGFTRADAIEDTIDNTNEATPTPATTT